MAGRWWIAVMEPMQRERVHDPAARPVLCLPKGNVDAGETPEQAAQREIREETGVDADLIEKIADSRYNYVRHWGDGKPVAKVVKFYLFRYRSGHIGEIAENMRGEVRSARWIPLDEAEQHLAYGGEKVIVKKARTLVAALNTDTADHGPSHGMAQTATENEEA